MFRLTNMALKWIWGIYTKVCPEGTQSCNMKYRGIFWRRQKIQETLYIGQWCPSPLQSRQLGTSRSSPSHHQLPCRILLNLTDGLKSLPFQRWFQFWKKPEVTGCHIWAVGSCIHGWFDVSPKTSAWDMDVGMFSRGSCQSPVAHNCGLLNYLNSICWGMFKLNTKSDAG